MILKSLKCQRRTMTTTSGHEFLCHGTRRGRQAAAAADKVVPEEAHDHCCV